MEISSVLMNLFYEALQVSKNAYAPYSNFKVGAAVLLEDDSVVTGVNVENRSYGLTNCAERSAVFSAASRGKTKFKAIAIAAPDACYPVSPCGACRQVISEFMDGEADVIFGSKPDNVVLTKVKNLFPYDSLHELKNDP